MKRASVLVYGLACYLLTVAVVLYLACFLGDRLVPKTINSGDASSPVLAVCVDLVLLVLFGLQHSGMARNGFKRGWTRVVPQPVERSTYVLLSNLALLVLMWLWRPLPGVVWDMTSTPVEWPIWLLSGVGVLLLSAASFHIDHWELLGLRQVWDYANKRESRAVPFRAPGLYRFVRHPLMTGLLLALWATPRLTAGRLLFSAAMTAYVLLALRWEERDLSARFGRAYDDYRARVPALIPWRWGKP